MADATAVAVQALLVGLSIAYDLAFRSERRQPGSCFSNLSAVVACELVKLVCSLVMVVATLGAGGAGSSLARAGTTEWRLTALFAVPSALFTAQNYVFLVAQSNLSVTLYLVSKQLAIPMTALSWVLIRQRPLACDRWVALCIIVIGVAALGMKGDLGVRGSLVLGLASNLAGVFISSITMIAMEKLLQDTEGNMWEVNVKLSSFGVLIALCVLFAEQGAGVIEHGIFLCFTPTVWGLMVLQASLGLTTAAVLKYTDSVTKCVAKAFAMVCGSMMSRIIFQEGPELTSPRFLIGMAATFAGTVMFSLGAPEACAPRSGGAAAGSPASGAGPGGCPRDAPPLFILSEREEEEEGEEELERLVGGHASSLDQSDHGELESGEGDANGSAAHPCKDSGLDAICIGRASE